MRSWLAVFLKLVLLLIALFALMPQAALALTASQVYEQVKDSVVVVKAYNQKGQQVGLGSGVMLPSGDIITNYHVVKTGVRYMVGQGAKATPATLKSGDPDKDLCLLTAPGLTAKPARMGKAAKLKVGEPVYAVGAPQGLELSLSEGIVSQLRGGPPPLIQTTAAVSSGSSGGGLFNAEGELVGITTFYLKDSQSLNFALPVEWIGEVARLKNPERGAIVADKAPIAPVPGARPKEYWENRAVVLEKAQDWEGLLDHTLRWRRAEPDNDLARRWDYLAMFGAGTRKDPDSHSSWFYLGVSYSELDRYREANEAYQKALSFKADLPELESLTWECLGKTYAKLGRNREAIEAYRQALRLYPDNHLAWTGLGNVYAKLGRHREAIEAHREATRHLHKIWSTPENYSNSWSGLALSYAQLGNRSAALEAVKELRRYDPQRAEKLFNLIMKP